MYEPVFIDMALSVVAGNRLDIYRRRNEPIPEGWAFDTDGEPTTDPNDMRKGGTLAPMQGYKGAGLAVVLGMMTSFLGGAMFDDQKRDPANGRPISGTTGHFFQAHDIGAVHGPRSVLRGRPREHAPASGPRRRRPASSGPTPRATSRTPRRRPTPARACRWSSSPWTTWSGSPSSWASNTTSSEIAWQRDPGAE